MLDNLEMHARRIFNEVYLSLNNQHIIPVLNILNYNTILFRSEII